MVQEVKLSVRNLIEFVLRSGDIVSGKTGTRDVQAMQEGSRIHRKIQRRMGTNYQAEVPLSIKIPITYDEGELALIIEGRADGILTEEESVTIDEIKAMYLDVSLLEEPLLLHLAQAKCYAYIYCMQKELKTIDVRVTYCQIETEVIRCFQQPFSFEELETWFMNLINEYSKWAIWQAKWMRQRNESIEGLNFPYSYRPGQKQLVKGVYQTIARDKKLYIEAPTGVGKTISTLFPAIKQMGTGKVQKLFYLTAKTITRTVATKTCSILIEKGMKLKVITITAKDKICVCDTVSCNPNDCERAKGHYDRVNAAIFDLLTNEDEITRGLIEQYATKHCVCPFEMSLDVTLWSDCIICDYNYVFDPNVYLRRFFQQDKKMDYVFLVDEAHNLVERAREMYSARLVKEDFLEMKRYFKLLSSKVTGRLEACNQDLLKYKRLCEDYALLSEIDSLGNHLIRLASGIDEFLQEATEFDHKEEIMQFYFELRHFLNMYEIMDEKYYIYTDYGQENQFQLTLQCMDPSKNLNFCLERGRSTIFFSATLLPIQYYKEQLAGRKDDYEMYIESPFSKEQRKILLARDVSTKYSRRNYTEFSKIARYIHDFTKAKVGNYLVFFPSYQMMSQVHQIVVELYEDLTLCDVVLQHNHMTELEKEQFLKEFEKSPGKTRIGFCVMGGIFSEGIDLQEDRLIGVVVVGTGLPMVCTEKEIYRKYYDELQHNGFEYAYLYQGMNKVLQSAGRVIRTLDDWGGVLLLDERFYQPAYQKLFPREWFPYETVTMDCVYDTMKQFWKKKEDLYDKGSDI